MIFSSPCEVLMTSAWRLDVSNFKIAGGAKNAAAKKMMETRFGKCFCIPRAPRFRGWRAVYNSSTASVMFLGLLFRECPRLFGAAGGFRSPKDGAQPIHVPSYA